MKRGSTKIAQLHFTVEDQVRKLRRGDMKVYEICERLGLHKKSEENRVRQICDEPGLKPFMAGLDSPGPVKAGRNPAAVIRP
jgi:hypothetical protein